ncbi:MAG: hypothetical protein WC532_07175 [Candidatus Omnitrophota bacterium]
MATGKLRYEVDPHNRLVVSRTGLEKFRRVLEGRFSIAAGNTLTYHIKSPIPADIKLPHQVKLKGAWSLTEEHQLRLTLDKWGRQTFGDQLTLQGEIIAGQKNSLLFAVTSRAKDGRQSVYILELSGSWQADIRNRLTFKANKERASYDLLTFEAAWQVDENYKLIYRYKKEDLLRKRKRIQAIAFQGHWDIRDKARLSYVLDKNSGSSFDFKTSLGIFKDNYIKYELGIGLAQRVRPVRRRIIFSGKWQVNKNAGLVFSVEQGSKKIQEFAFGAEAKLTDKATVLFNLRNSLDKGIGAELELSRAAFKGNGQAFLRLIKSRQESAVFLGAGWGW